VRQFLAWKSIDDQRETLNLDAFQAGQAASKRKQADETVDARLPETYSLLLLPEQRAGESEVTWQELRLQGSEALAVRASRKLKADGLLITEFGPPLLRMELDRVPLWQDDDVGVRQLWDYFTRYLYLPRLRDEDVLIGCIAKGTASLTGETDGFAYAEAWDETRGRYAGLRLGRGGSVVMDGRSLVVKPEAARRQLDAEASAPAPVGDPGTYPVGKQDGDGAGPREGPTAAPAPRLLRRFHGTVQLDATRLARDAGTVAEEVVQHLSGIVGSKVTVTVEIEAEIPDGASDQVVRTVNENARTLKFNSFGFEES
jgi:hypothetical protein